MDTKCTNFEWYLFPNAVILAAHHNFTSSYYLRSNVQIPLENTYMYMLQNGNQWNQWEETFLYLQTYGSLIRPQLPNYYFKKNH